MSANGKRLEGLVAFVEETLLPQGFDVKTNERIFNDDGVQIAEFDVEIRGKVGTTNIAWLIECRDRPGSGTAPVNWIEQLVGRRIRFGFDKVTAVSTTGFSAGAIEFAKLQGIELRQVDSLCPSTFADWLVIQHINQTENRANLVHGSVLLNPAEAPDHVDAVALVLSGANGDAKILRSVKTSELSSLTSAFLGAIESQDLFNGIEPNGRTSSISLRVKYTNDDDHFVIDTDVGAVRVEEIVFTGELSITESQIPIGVTAEYRHTDSGELISQVASFQPQTIQDSKFSLEMHRLTETGETHIMMRRL